MQVMVLAAGFGTRLGPLTNQRAKPAVPFLGVPLVRTLVESLGSADRIVVNLHHRPETVQRSLEGLDVRFSAEPEILGTAGGIALAVQRGLLRRDEPLLVVNGKISTDLDFRSLWERHACSAADATLALVANPTREPFREVLVRDELVVGFGDGNVPAGPKPWAFTGVYVLSPSFLWRLEPVMSDTVRDHLPEPINRGGVNAWVHPGRWWELSTPERYLTFHLEARRRGFEDRAPPLPEEVTESVVWEGARIARGARLHRCIVLSGAEVRDVVEEELVILSPDARHADALVRTPLARNEVKVLSEP
ncbi:MAG: NTP transferase domain-containing protein [Myxococcales bacterium]|nr:NTP transferase domain-containing protein [Myxococcales bacterium]